MSHVMFHMSCVMCHVSKSHVPCHLSPTSTAKATHPSPANSPTVQSRLVCHKRTKTLKNFKISKYCPKTSKKMES